jgi:hypothetical protein
MYGSGLRVGLDTRMGDSAIVTMERMCRGISTGEHILLVRRNGKWTIDKVIDGFTRVAM